MSVLSLFNKVKMFLVLNISQINRNIAQTDEIPL